MKAWFSAAELAGKPGMPSRSKDIARLAKKKHWESRPRAGRGGGLEWSIDSFAPQTQTALAPALLEQSTQACPSSPSGDMAKAARASALSAGAELATLAAIYEGKSQREKDEASARLGIVTGYHHLRTSGVGRAAALETVSGARQVSIATITRYLARVEGKPEHAWLYLLTPRYCGRTTTSDISAEAWEILQADFLRRERPAPRACITRLREAAAGRGWALPSDRTLERRLARLPRAVQILAREGARALSESYPAQQRSKAALVALQIVNADGYKHNLWVRFPDGEVIRAKTWYWQDVYSSKILAWRTDKTEHTDMVRLAFGDLVERWGIPEAVLLDNTLAAANKTMSGGIRHRFRF
jgi:hypothetical protein